MQFFLIKDKPLTEEEKKENPPGWDPVAYNDMVIKDLRDQLCNTKQRTKNIFKEIQQSLSRELEDILFNGIFLSSPFYHSYPRFSFSFAFINFF